MSSHAQVMDRVFKKYTNEHSKFMEVDGVKIHYRDEGEGFPVVMIHGAFSSLHTYNDWSEELKDDFRIIRLTLPGFGLTGPCPRDIYNIESHLLYLKHFLQKLEVDKFNLVGSSLGGWIAWEYALAYPLEVNKMILISAAGFVDSKSIPLPFKMARTPFVNKVIKYVIRRNVLEQFLRQVYIKKERVTADLVDRYYELFTRNGNPEAFLKMCNSKLIDHTRKLSEIETATLIQWGQEDIWLPVDNALRFRTMMPNAKLIIYQGLGHVPMEEAPEETVKDAWSFMKHNWF